MKKLLNQYKTWFYAQPKRRLFGVLFILFLYGIVLHFVAIHAGSEITPVAAILIVFVTVILVLSMTINILLKR